MGSGHVIFALGRSGGFLSRRGLNFSSASNGIELALQRLDLLLDGDDLVKLGCR